MSMTLESFFPNQEYPFCLYSGFFKPYEYIKQLLKWKNSGKPMRVIITGTPINYAMAIESLTYSEVDGTGDVYFSLELKEYKFISTTKQTTKTSNGTILTTPITIREVKSPPDSYVVKQGDTLWLIAMKLTGDGNNYKAIAKKNGITDPSKLLIGQRLVI